jgi:hypothetical protein
MAEDDGGLCPGFGGVEDRAQVLEVGGTFSRASLSRAATALGGGDAGGR